MEIGIDFVDYLETDLTSSILTCLNDPADLVRVSCVSRPWRHFVIAHGMCKKLWLRKVPQIANISYAAEESNGVIRLSDVLSGNPAAWQTLKTEHKIYTSLLQALAKPVIFPVDCIAFPIGASSTDHELENIVNTLVPADRFHGRASYWSSKGHCDPNVPEYILYRLNSSICIVTEVNIQPFEVCWDPRMPVCSAKSVRFRMGHPKSLNDWSGGPVSQSSVDNYVWTYTSPEFPMTQESCLQKFKLPEPVVCVGGVVQIELLGRVQKAKIDKLFYICLAYVRVLGHTLEPAYKLHVLPSGDLHLEYYPRELDSVLRRFSGDNSEAVDTAEGALNILMGETEIAVGQNRLIRVQCGSNIYWTRRPRAL